MNVYVDMALVVEQTPANSPRSWECGLKLQFCTTFPYESSNPPPIVLDM